MNSLKTATQLLHNNDQDDENSNHQSSVHSLKSCSEPLDNAISNTHQERNNAAAVSTTAYQIRSMMRGLAG